MICIILFDVVLHCVQHKPYIFSAKFKNTVDVNVNTYIDRYDI